MFRVELILHLILQKKKKKVTLESLLELDDDGSQGSDRPISVIEISTGNKLTGDEAPMLSQLQDFLAQNPGWEIADTDDEDSDDDGDDDDDGRVLSCMYISQVKLLESK